jgi:hypothetical protein
MVQHDCLNTTYYQKIYDKERKKRSFKAGKAGYDKAFLDRH